MATIEKQKGRWGTTHYAIVGVPELAGDYQKTGNAFDTAMEAYNFARTRGIEIEPTKTVLAFEGEEIELHRPPSQEVEP